MHDSIPLVDLKAQYQAHKEELDAAVAGCLERGSFIGGPDHKAFGEEFAAFCGGGYTALCGNGTDALILALKELLGPGDGQGEVITVANTFIATSEAILQAGYRPVFVDVEPGSLLMDPDAAARAVTSATRAILPVHLFGQMARMDSIMAVAERHGLVVIEDSAQAHGASWLGKHPGQWGHAACFSFYPGKNLGAWGDGGAVFTREETLAVKVRKHADHGRSSKYLHESDGENSRLDGLQAAVLRVKLRHLENWTARRRELARLYHRLLTGERRVELPVVLPEAEHVFHLYAVQVDFRGAVLDGLKRRGVMAGVHYPIPLHRQPVYQARGYESGPLPITEQAASRLLSLPLYPEMTEALVHRVVKALGEALDEAGHA